MKKKRGNWTKNEDLKILRVVLTHGTKWSLLANESCERTEHSFKNRFFGILARFLKTPARTIKKTKDYLNPYLLRQIIEDLEE